MLHGRGAVGAVCVRMNANADAAAKAAWLAILDRPVFASPDAVRLARQKDRLAATAASSSPAVVASGSGAAGAGAGAGAKALPVGSTAAGAGPRAGASSLASHAALAACSSRSGDNGAPPAVEPPCLVSHACSPASPAHRTARPPGRPV